jgi:RNA polymerase sigma factor (sigma-70 family)
METPATKPESVGGCQPPLNDAECQLVIVVALAYARRHEIQGEDREDQALAFLLHLLQHLRDSPHPDLSLILSTAWLARSADNWMRSYMRVQRRRYRELAWPPDTTGSGEPATSLELPSKEPLPYTEAIRAEFCQRISSAIASAQFTDAQYELLVLVLEGERVVDIARLLKLPPETIRQRLRTIRVRLRKVLQACGLGEAEFQEYLSILGL